MSIATGRDPEAGELLHRSGRIDPPHRLAIPSVCFMEAYSTFPAQIKRLREFLPEFDRRSTDLRRDLLSSRAPSILRHLEAAGLEMEGWLDEMQVRLNAAVRILQRDAELVQLTPDMLLLSMTRPYLDDPTDNLIVNCIVEHARSLPGQDKVLLSGDSKAFRVAGVVAALRGVGVGHRFSNAKDCLGWLDSQSLGAADGSSPQGPRD